MRWVINTMRLFPIPSSSDGSPRSREESNGEKNSAFLYLNIYDLTPVNNYLYWFGLGIFHSGIEGIKSFCLHFNGWVPFACIIFSFIDVILSVTEIWIRHVLLCYLLLVFCYSISYYLCSYIFPPIWLMAIVLWHHML